MTLRWQLTWYVSSVLEECSIDVNLALKVARKEGPFHFFDAPVYIAIPSSNRRSILHASFYMTPQISILVSLALKMSRLRSKINCLPTLTPSGCRYATFLSFRDPKWDHHQVGEVGNDTAFFESNEFLIEMFSFQRIYGTRGLLHSCNCMGGERVTAKWRGLITCVNKARKAV
jgi:hypothetical protein